METTTSLSKRSKWKVNQKENIWKHFPNFQGDLCIFQGFQQKNTHFQAFQGHPFIFKAFQGFLRFQDLQPWQFPIYKGGVELQSVHMRFRKHGEIGVLKLSSFQVEK